jgi:hypothetical protein
MLTDKLRYHRRPQNRGNKAHVTTNASCSTKRAQELRISLYTYKAAGNRVKRRDNGTEENERDSKEELVGVKLRG